MCTQLLVNILEEWPDIYSSTTNEAYAFDYRLTIIIYEIFQELDILLYLSLVMVMNKFLYLIEP